MPRKLIGNRVAEKGIRDWLERKSFFGTSARFQELELHAVQRPGWVQVFRFQVEAKTKSGDWQFLYGVLRDDDRYNRVEIEVFNEAAYQQDKLNEWSVGCFQTRARRVAQGETGGQTWWGVGLLMGIAVLLFMIFAIRALMGAMEF